MQSKLKRCGFQKQIYLDIVSKQVLKLNTKTALLSWAPALAELGPAQPLLVRYLVEDKLNAGLKTPAGFLPHMHRFPYIELLNNQ